MRQPRAVTRRLLWRAHEGPLPEVGNGCLLRQHGLVTLGVCAVAHRACAPEVCAVAALVARPYVIMMLVV